MIGGVKNDAMKQRNEIAEKPIDDALDIGLIIDQLAETTDYGMCSSGKSALAVILKPLSSRIITSTG